MQEEAGLPPRPRPSRLPAAEAALLSGASGLAPCPPLSCRPRAGHGPGFALSRLTAVCRSAQGARSEGTTSPAGHRAPGGAGIGAYRRRSGSPARLPPDKLRGASSGTAAGDRGGREDLGPAGGGWGGESGTQQGEWPGPGLGKERARELREGKGPGLVGRDGGLPGPSVRGRLELLLLPGAWVPEYRSGPGSGPGSAPELPLEAVLGLSGRPGPERQWDLTAGVMKESLSSHQDTHPDRPHSVQEAQMLTSALARSWAWLGNTCPSKLQVHHQSGWGLHHFCFYFFKLSPFDREREETEAG